MLVTETNISTAIQAEGYAGTADIATTSTILQGVWRRVLALRRWAFLQGSANLVVTVGSETVSLASITDLAKVDAVRLSIGTEGYDPTFVPPQRMRSFLKENPSTTGAPSMWSQYGGSVLLYPRPDRAYSLTADYTLKPTYSATNIVFPEEHQDVLVWGCIVRKAYRQRDWQGLQFAEEQYRAHLQEMKTALGLEQRQGTLEVERSGVWNEVAG